MQQPTRGNKFRIGRSNDGAVEQGGSNEEFRDEASGVAAMVFQLGLEMRNDADQQNSLGLYVGITMKS